METNLHFNNRVDLLHSFRQDQKRYSSHSPCRTPVVFDVFVFLFPSLNVPVPLRNICGVPVGQGVRLVKVVVDSVRVTLLNLQKHCPT